MAAVVAATVILLSVIGFSVSVVLAQRSNGRRDVESILSFFVDTVVNSSVSSFAPGGRRQDTTVGESLRLTVARAAKDYADRPSLHAHILERLIGAFRMRGEYDEAESTAREVIRLFELAADTDSPEFWKARARLGDLLLERGRVEEAVQELVEVHGQVARRHPDSRVELLARRYALNARCEAGTVDCDAYERCLADHGRAYDATDAEPFQMERDYLWALHNDGRLDQCLTRYSQVMDRLNESGVSRFAPVLPAVCTLYAAFAHYAAGSQQEALRLLGDMPEAVDRELGPGHPAAFDVRRLQLAISLASDPPTTDEPSLSSRLALRFHDPQLPPYARRWIALLCAQSALRCGESQRAIEYLEAGDRAQPGFQNRIMGSVGEMKATLGRAYAAAGRHSDADLALTAATRAFAAELETTLLPGYSLFRSRIKRLLSAALTTHADVADALSRPGSAAALRERAQVVLMPDSSGN